MVTAQKKDTVKLDAAKKVVSLNPKTKLSKAVAPKSVATAMETPVKTAAKKTTPAKSRASQVSAQKTVVNAEQRANYVEVVAYYIAERRGFTEGNPVDDWLAAEAEVDRLIATGQFAH